METKRPLSARKAATVDNESRERVEDMPCNIPAVSCGLMALAALSCAPQGDADMSRFPYLSGPWLGQSPPGSEPGLFAPGIVSTGVYERDMAAMPGGTELYFCIIAGQFERSAIVVTQMEHGRWTEPAVAPFCDTEYINIEPAIAPDGSRLYFISDRPAAGGIWNEGDTDIWVMDRADGGWSKPRNLGPPVNSGEPEYFPSVTRDGTLYFTRESQNPRGSAIYRSRLVDGRYAEPERLGPVVNSTANQYNAYVAPDETYLIVPVYGREDSFGATDYYICFRNADDTWTGPVNLGAAINTSGGQEYSPYVTPDGRYFFFMAARFEMAPGEMTWRALQERHGGPGNGLPDIYWVDAAFLQTLRPQ